MLRKRILILALGLMLQFSAASASATTFDLDLLDPDIVSANIAISYAEATDTLTIHGNTLSVLNGDNLDVTGDYDLVAIIDGNGDLVSGTLTLTGELDPWLSGTLLTAVLTDFDWNLIGAILEFTFDATGGDMQSLYPAGGGTIIGNFTLGFDPDWESNWSNFGFDTSDTAPVIPEPATGLSLLFGLAFLSAARRRRQS